VLDIRGVDETAEVSRRLLLGLRDQLRAVGGESVMVDPTQTVINLDSDPSQRIRHFPDVNAAIEYAEDSLIARYGGAETKWRRIDVRDHPLLVGLPEHQLELLRSRLEPRSYRDAEPVVLAGQPPHGLYLVLSGMVDVSAEQGDVRHHLSMFTVGTTFGTIYAVTQRGYDIDAHARDDVEALLLPMAAIAELSETAPDLMLALQRRMLAGAFDSLDWVTRALVTPN
jgi:glutaminase